MIKRSAILLLFLALGSISLLLLASYTSAAPAAVPAEGKPVKCSERCTKKNQAPLPWNILSPAMFANQG
jgi:hypothetical protein